MAQLYFSDSFKDKVFNIFFYFMLCTTVLALVVALTLEAAPTITETNEETKVRRDLKEWHENAVGEAVEIDGKDYTILKYRKIGRLYVISNGMNIKKNDVKKFVKD